MPTAIWVLFTIAAMSASTSAGVAENPKMRPSSDEGHGAETYLRYAHPTIREPFVDQLNLVLPVELAAQTIQCEDEGRC